MSETQSGPAWSGQPLPPQQGDAPWGQPAPTAAPPQFPPPTQVWQPRVDVLPGGGRSGRSLPSFGRAPVLVLVVALVAAGGYFGWKKFDKPSSNHAVARPVAVRPVAPIVKPTPVPTTNAKISETGWDLTTIHPVAPPVPVAGLAIAYTVDGGQLTLNGIEPSTGAVVWSKPATVAQSSPDDASIAVANIGNTVFFYQASGAPADHTAVIVAVDAATGTQKWVTAQAATYSEMPAVCSDGATICTSVNAPNNVFQEVRTNATTGAQTVISSTTGTKVGAGLWDAGTSSPQYIEHINDTTGATVWKDRVDQLFGTAVSSDQDGDWASFGSAYVGFVPPDLSTVSTHPVALSSFATVGIRASDGARLWRHAGAYGCIAQDYTDEAGQPFPVRCVFTGTISVDAKGNPAFSGLTVTVQGFNPQTGATLWSDRLGNVPAILNPNGNTQVRVHPDVFAVTDATGHTTMINLKTGATAVAPPTQSGWCLHDGSTFNLTGYDAADGTPADFTAAGGVAPCTAAGAPSAPTDGTAVQVGTTVGAYFIWSSTDGLHAYKVGTPT